MKKELGMCYLEDAKIHDLSCFEPFCCALHEALSAVHSEGRVVITGADRGIGKDTHFIKMTLWRYPVTKIELEFVE